MLRSLLLIAFSMFFREAGSNGLMTSMSASGAETERAEREWDKALRYDPGLAEARFQLALLYAQRAQTGRALRFFNAIAADQPTHPQGVNRIALALTAAGAFDPAIRVLKQGLRDFPDNAALLTNLAPSRLSMHSSH